MNFRKLSAFNEKIINWTKKPLNEKLDSFINRYYAVENNVFEKKHGLDFDGDIDAKDLVADSKFSLDNAYPYQAYGNPRFKRLIEEAILCGDGFDRFVDIGCGKGKQCVYAAKYFKFDEVIGIEFSRKIYIDLVGRA
jgi:tRNA G46 methylase TrmB